LYVGRGTPKYIQKRESERERDYYYYYRIKVIMYVGATRPSGPS